MDNGGNGIVRIHASLSQADYKVPGWVPLVGDGPIPGAISDTFVIGPTASGKIHVSITGDPYPSIEAYHVMGAGTTTIAQLHESWLFTLGSPGFGRNFEGDG